MNRTAFHRNAPKYYVTVIIRQDSQDKTGFPKTPHGDGRTPAIRGGGGILRTISIKNGTSYLSTITKLFSNGLSCA